MERLFNKRSFENKDLEALMASTGYAVLIESYAHGSEQTWEVPQNYKTFVLSHATPESPTSAILVIDPDRTDYIRMPITKELAGCEDKIIKMMQVVGYANTFTQYPSSNDMPTHHLICLKSKTGKVSSQ